ncbi:integral membrane protein [Colletotrichum karsti]|uniref:Integral membrane protein n=1 Tax=Colletotrichum karsti TaxID=1095194 RepID=A0A9P6I1C2_9PEZI|nr:uncharacterized protein CkaCkLH20_08007 [Colletotrichum karsti]KAF9874444.1 integral membrane protein [Colletotrichum karsti]
MDPGQSPPPYTDENRAGLLIGISAAFVSAAFILVVLRVYVRAAVIKKWGPDDTLVVISFVLVMLTGAIFSICTRYGLSYHVWTIPVSVQQAGRRLTIIATLCYHCTFITIKMAFLLQFRRVFTVPKFRLICDIIFVFICCFGTAVIVSSIIMAVPTWNGDTFAAERYDQGTWWLATSVVHLITDIVIFLLPLPLLRKLKLKRMLKVALMVSFGLGFVTTVISIIRITTLGHTFTRDVTYDVIPALVWSEIELCCAVMCACIPTLRPLLRVITGHGDSRKEWSGPNSYEGENSRLTRKPLKAITTVSSEQSIVSPGLFGAEPKTPTLDHRPDGALVIRTAISPALTATAGDSDDGSDVFGPVDEEVATPLSPPPKAYSSPTRSRFPSLPVTPEDEESCR